MYGDRDGPPSHEPTTLSYRLPMQPKPPSAPDISSTLEVSPPESPLEVRSGSLPAGLRLDGELGRGGTGVVWRGWWKQPSGVGRPVAVKVLHQALEPDGLEARRLRDEARVLARLRHRGAVLFVDLVTVEGRPALVTELVEGVDLSDVIARGPLPPKAAAEVVAEVAGVLEAAHHGVPNDSGQTVVLVHRDVKPANVRLTRWAEVKLVDFGAAHAAMPERESRTAGYVLGSRGYVAPEARDGTVGPPADVYGLGVLTWEALMGARLGALSRVPAAHADQVKQALARIQHPELRALIGDMLHHSPDKRPEASLVRRRFADACAALPGQGLRQLLDHGLLGEVAQSGTLLSRAKAETPDTDMPNRTTDRLLPDMGPTLLVRDDTATLQPSARAGLDAETILESQSGNTTVVPPPQRIPRLPIEQAPHASHRGGDIAFDMGGFVAGAIVGLALLSIVAAAVACALVLVWSP